MTTYKENVGANCENCNNTERMDKKRCKLCATKDNRPGWEPASGVKVKEYDLYWGPLQIKAMGREVVKEATA